MQFDGNTSTARTSPQAARPLLLIISDRPFVWNDYRTPEREVRRWGGEREADRERGGGTTFVGDPALPETYRWAEASPNLCAVVDLQDGERGAGVINALRKIRPEAGVLVITANGDLSAKDIAVSRRLAWTDALRGDLEVELRQLEAQRCVHALRQFAAQDEAVPILVHPDPDPDALASALAIRALLRQPAERNLVVTLGQMTRPENRRMSELLRLGVTLVTLEELRRLERLIAVDHVPELLIDEPGATQQLAVIDHHPGDKFDAAFSDVRPHYGATATILTEYLRADDEKRIAEPLATALLYGIKTDTDSLARGCSAADVEAYAFLHTRADLPLLRKLERPSYSLPTARAYGQALSTLAVDNDWAVAFLGRIPEADAHVLTDIADFCLGLKEVVWSAAGAVIDDQLVITLRHLGGCGSAGELAQRLTKRIGQGGGHATMARARLPLRGELKEFADLEVKIGAERLLNMLRR